MSKKNAKNNQATKDPWGYLAAVITALTTEAAKKTDSSSNQSYVLKRILVMTRGRPLKPLVEEAEKAIDLNSETYFDIASRAEIELLGFMSPEQVDPLSETKAASQSSLSPSLIKMMKVDGEDSLSATDVASTPSASTPSEMGTTSIFGWLP